MPDVILSTDTLKTGRPKINTKFVELDAELAEQDARVDTIIQGGGPDKDSELVDIRTPDASYTPAGVIAVAGDITRDMQVRMIANEADLAAHEADTTQRGINVMHLPAPYVSAVGDGIINDAVPFASALSLLSTAGGGQLIIPSKTFLLTLTETLAIPSNVTILNYGTINLGSNDVIAFTATSKSNVRFIGGQINGTGVSGSAWAIYFDSCTDSSIEFVKIRDGSSSGINFASCTNCKVLHCDIQECYFYGISDKLGTGNVFSHNELSNNGYGASTGGRGITVWMCNGAEITYNKVKNNNEYGIRVFTATADTSDTKKVLIHGNECVDNALIDIYVYAELDPSYAIVSENFVEQTTDSTATGIAVQGIGVKANDNILKKFGTANGTGFSLYDAVKCDIKNNKIFGYATAIVPSGTVKSSYCVLEGNEAYDCKVFVKMQGEHNITRNNTAVHNATAAASGEIGYQQSDNSVGCVVEGNKFTGFHSAVILDFNVDIVIRNNIARSSVHSGFRSGLTDFHSMTIIGNDWADSGSVEILRSLEVRNGKYKFTATAIPSTGMATYAFVVGDRFFLRTPTVGGVGSGICTTAGTGGTWSLQQTGVMTSIAAIPSFVGQVAVVGGVGYVATGVSSSSDWKQTTP